MSNAVVISDLSGDDDASHVIALRPGSFHPRLVDVMAVIAKRLPVIDAPEQHHIPPVRDYVIHQRCQQRASVAEIDAPRV